MQLALDRPYNLPIIFDASARLRVYARQRADALGVNGALLYALL